MLIEAGPFKVRRGAIVVAKEVAEVDCCALDPDDLEIALGLVAVGAGVGVGVTVEVGDVDETVLAPMQT